MCPVVCFNYVCYFFAGKRCLFDYIIFIDFQGKIAIIGKLNISGTRSDVIVKLHELCPGIENIGVINRGLDQVDF